VVKRDNAVLIRAIARLALAGEQAGFTVEEMIELLNTGISVETLLDLVCGQSKSCQSLITMQ